MYDLIEEKEIMQQFNIKSRTTIYNMTKNRRFPAAVLNYPKRYDRKAVIEWFNNGGINQRA